MAYLFDMILERLEIFFEYLVLLDELMMRSIDAFGFSIFFDIKTIILWSNHE
jgi:hypothetical protein